MEEHKNKDCKQICSRLSEYVDAELPPNEERLVRQHLSVCLKCKAEYVSLKNLLSYLPDTAKEPPRALYSDTMKKIRRHKAFWHSTKRCVKTVASLAAALIIVSTLAFALPLIYSPEKTLSGYGHKNNADGSFDRSQFPKAQTDITRSSDSIAAEENNVLTYDSTPENATDKNDADCPLTPELQNTVNEFYLLNSRPKVVYLSLKTEIFEELRKSLPANLVLYSDSLNIAFEYKKDLNLPEQIKEKATNSDENLLVVACMTDFKTEETHP